jgi:hypothetical protein
MKLHRTTHIRTVVKIAESSPRAEYEGPSHKHICDDRGRASPPNKWITEEVDLAMIFDPEVLTSRLSDINFNLDKQLTIPRRRCTQPKGRELYQWRSVNSAIVVHMTFCSSQNLEMKPGTL